MATSPVTGQKMVVETLLEFVNYDENNEVDIGEGCMESNFRNKDHKNTWLLRL
jgi:hypothetical protein